MATILALDVGDSRVGTALSDTDLKFALPGDTLERKGGEAERQILEIISDKAISTMVVGLPLGENGEETEQSEKIRRFVRRIERRVSVEVIYIDEYGTSEEAKAKLYSAGTTMRSLEKGVLDAVAASIILQTYLDRKSKG